ncbi:VOC family protein [Nocardioides sp. GCM10027113]|uniref:VOC family protein n=1 Tax=unclassified Nocardioides TaxID=2615069 RepID=UPI0036165583
MTETPLARLLGDPSGLVAQQRARLLALGIDVAGMAASHLAFRTSTADEYVAVRTALERFSTANVENVWNGRPISKLLLTEPLRVADDLTVPMVELIPPPHQSVYRMGLEHVGFVVGPGFDEFASRHREAFTGRQDQGPWCRPWYVTFDDHTNVKFYRRSLRRVCVLEGRRFDGFHHASAAAR